METLLATVSASMGFAVLALSGAIHFAKLDVFKAMLRSHNFWPPTFVTVVAQCVALAECTIASLGLAALLPGLSASTARDLMTYALAGAMVLYVALAAYAAVLLRRNPGVPCACSSRAEPISIWVPVRTTVLALGCGFAAAQVDLVLSWTWSSDALLAFLAASTFTVLAWILPSTLHDPNKQGISWTSRPAH
ncbi:hypothetical protein SMC26_40765 [Actinomadura fulvescens]|uniref:Methylamine utilisation protein MauE domain-containing protein n=1 Tax=Actinomadura fulvescens TaxID=46160 RepID=A0ABP6D9A5_9ACTN